MGSLGFDGEPSPLQAFVEAEARELPSAAFATFMQELYTAIDRLIVTNPRCDSKSLQSGLLCVTPEYAYHEFLQQQSYPLPATVHSRC